MKTFFTLCWLISNSPTSQVDKYETIFQLLKCEEINTTSAIIIYETGWMQAYKLKVDCAQKHFNLPGFRYKNKYIVFSGYSASIEYYRGWQKRHWHKYRKRNPGKSYYQFLKAIGYCNRMDDYIKVIKRIEKQ